jgi:hypothetical protein
MKLIENLTTISKDEVNLGKSPSVIRTTQNGSCALCNLSEGWHNVTFYLITDHEISLFRSYEKGEILCSATTEFIIDIPFFPTALAVTSATIVAIVSMSLLIYFKKRNHQP